MSMPSEMNSDMIFNSKKTIYKIQNKLIKQLDLNNRFAPLNKNECHMALNLVNLICFEQDWDRLVRTCSRIILNGCGPHTALYLYRYWIEALYRNEDLKSLKYLGLHLFKQRKSSLEALALSLLCFSLLGNYKLSKMISDFLIKKSLKSYYYFEAHSIFKIKFAKQDLKISGLTTLMKLIKNSTSHYCSYLQGIEFAKKMNNYENQAFFFRLMRSRYKFAPYPYYALCVLAIEDKDFVAGLQNAIHIGKHIHSILEVDLLRVHCLLECGEFLQAESHYLRIIKNNENCLHWHDYLIGSRVYKKLWDRYNDEDYKNKSLSYLSYAKELSINLEIGEAWFSSIEDSFKNINQKHDNTEISHWLAFVSNGLSKDLLERNENSVFTPKSCKSGDEVIFCTAQDEKINELNILCQSSVHIGARRHSKNTWFSVIRNKQAFENMKISIKEIFEYSNSTVYLDNLLKNEFLSFIKISSKQSEMIVSHLESAKNLSHMNSRTG